MVTSSGCILWSLLHDAGSYSADRRGRCCASNFGMSHRAFQVNVPYFNLCALGYCCSYIHYNILPYWSTSITHIYFCGNGYLVLRPSIPHIRCDSRQSIHHTYTVSVLFQPRAILQANISSVSVRKLISMLADWLFLLTIFKNRVLDQRERGRGPVGRRIPLVMDCRHHLFRTILAFILAIKRLHLYFSARR